MEHAGLNDLQKQIIRFKYETPHITNVEIGNRLGEGRKRIDRNQQYAQRDMERYLLANPEEAKALTEGTIPVRDVYYNGNKVLGSVTGLNLEELLCKTFPYAHEMYRIKNPTSKYNYKVVKFHRPELKESESYTIYSVNVLEENGKYGIKVIQEGSHYNDTMYRRLQRKKSFERTTI
ncbi:hypothetical protein [Bacillus manliponensis]|uniref:hypothetical protein n=1 Tax=Bacillus manliponensis TaxID=574376 RepID=UPI0035142E60